MKFHKQRFRHDPENGQIGDCHRTAIACVLDLDLEDVPHFAEMFPFGPEGWAKANDAILAWLAERGLSQVEVPFAGHMSIDFLFECMRLWNPNAIYLLCGQSQRGVNHTVVCRGGELLHDPHPSNTGLIGPADGDPGTERHWWVTFIVPSFMTLSGVARAA